MKTRRTIKRVTPTGLEKVPPGWERVRLGDVVDLINGFAFTPHHWGRRGLPIVRIQNLNDPNAPFNYFDGDLPDRFRVKTGDVLFAWSGTPGTSFGAHIWNGGDAWVNQHIFKVEFDRDCLDPGYVKAAINHNLESYIAEAQGGGGLAHVNKRVVDNSTIPLAPLNEQRRIVAAIQDTSREIDEGDAALRRARDTLKQFTQSVLRAAAEGELTSVWRASNPAQDAVDKPASPRMGRLGSAKRKGNSLPLFASTSERAEAPPSDLPALPATWAWSKVMDVGEVRLGRQRTPRTRPGAKLRPYLRVANVFEDRIDTSDVLKMPFTDAEARTFALESGDVLLNEGQSLELVGRPAIYRGEVPGACFQNTLIRFRPYQSVTSEFALVVFRYYLHVGRFQRAAKWTTNIAHLSAGRFGEIEFPLPPLIEQRNIVEQVEARLAEVAESERAIDEGLLKSVELRRSTLRQALSGKLVPQDSHDEPVSALLERIRASKETRLVERKAAMKRKRTQPKVQQVQEKRSLAEVLRGHAKGLTPESLLKEAGFDLAHVDDFYAELRTLQSRLAVRRPSKSEERLWPKGADILVSLKGK